MPFEVGNYNIVKLLVDYNHGISINCLDEQ